MVFSMGNLLWRSVTPILQLWMLAPKIEILKRFVPLFKPLDQLDKDLLVRQMTGSDQIFHGNFGIREIYDYVKSDFLVALVEDYMSEDSLIHRHGAIMRSIVRAYAYTFRDEFSSPDDMQELMWWMIEAAPNSHVPMLVVMYNIIWRKVVARTNIPDELATRVVETPSPLPNRERARRYAAMMRSDIPYIAEIFTLHAELDNNCRDYVDDMIRDIGSGISKEVVRLQALMELTNVM